jgi:hypothetical protein
MFKIFFRLHVKGLKTKQVQEMNCNYMIWTHTYRDTEKNTNIIPYEFLNNTNVGFVILLKRNDKPWMNRTVRSVNLQIDRSMMRHVMSHINVTDTDTIVRETYLRHGLHIKKKRWSSEQEWILQTFHLHNIPINKTPHVSIVYFLLLCIPFSLIKKTEVKFYGKSIWQNLYKYCNITFSSVQSRKFKWNC